MNDADRLAEILAACKGHDTGLYVGDGTAASCHEGLNCVISPKGPHVVATLNVYFAEFRPNGQLFAAAPETLAIAERQQARIKRLVDLVRYQRAELHDAGLITDEEYADLVNVDGSRVRLETYDDMRVRIAELEAAIERLRDLADSWGDTAAAYEMRHAMLAEDGEDTARPGGTP